MKRSLGSHYEQGISNKRFQMKEKYRNEERYAPRSTEDTNEGRRGRPLIE